MDKQCFKNLLLHKPVEQRTENSRRDKNKYGADFSAHSYKGNDSHKHTDAESQRLARESAVILGTHKQQRSRGNKADDCRTQYAKDSIYTRTFTVFHQVAADYQH